MSADSDDFDLWRDPRPTSAAARPSVSESSDPVEDTLAYYDGHADAFIARTASVSMDHLYAPFLALVDDGGHILDAGCGSGRDAAAFASRGYRVTAFDGSAGMARRASARTGLPIETMPFDAVNWNDTFDGVWACASLLHLPSASLPPALVRLVQALRPGGVLFVSMKEGAFEGRREDRWFTDVTPDDLRALLTSSGLEIERIWTADEVRGDTTVRWVNALARRPAETRTST
jgi:SAM-dependent methyltransferase